MAATVRLMRDFPLGPALGQCCGGHVSVLFEPMRPRAAAVALFGAGHVGRALVRVLGDLPLRVDLDRFAAGRVSRQAVRATSRTVFAADPAAQVGRLPAGTLVLVMTHDHQIDFAIVAAALARDDFAACRADRLRHQTRALRAPPGACRGSMRRRSAG